MAQGDVKKFIEDINEDPGALTHWIAVKKRVPVKYIPKYQTKTIKTVTTEELNEEKIIEEDQIKDWKLGLGKSIYYRTIEDAQEDIDRLSQLEESKIRDISGHEFDKVYSGDIVRTYEPVRTTFRQSTDPINIHKRVYDSSKEHDHSRLPSESWRKVEYIVDENSPHKEELE